MADTDLAPWAVDLPKDSPPPSASAAPHADGDLAPWMADVNTPASAPHKAPHHAPAPHGAPEAPPAPQTRFQRAAAPAPKSEPELSWEDTAKQAWSNTPASAAGAVGAMWNAVSHAPDTLKSIGQLGVGFGSQAYGAMGGHQDPAEKARNEALAKAVEAHYGQAYGSVKGFKKAVATDPVSVLMDASTVLGGGAGAAGKVAGLEKAASVAGKVASAIDPVANAVRVAKKASQFPVFATRKASELATGVPSHLMSVAAEAGKTSNPALRGAFMKFYAGHGDPAEILGKMQDAVGQMRNDASAEYLGKKSTLAPVQPDFGPVDAAIQEARNKTMLGGVRGPQFPAANDAIDEAENIVSHYKAQLASGNPAYGGLDGFDNLKQALYNVGERTGDQTAKNMIGVVYQGAKKALVDADPEYANLMEQWQRARNEINDATKTMIGAGKNPSATTAVNKAIRALKVGNKSVFDKLAQYDPSIPYALAGHALSGWLPGGLRGVAEFPTAAALSMFAHPLAGLGSIAAQSPKLAGAVNLGLGGIERLAGPLAKADYYAGRVHEEAAPEGAPAEAGIPAPEEAAPAIQHQANRIFNVMLTRESGNHQFRPDGAPLTSPKGAVGAAQIMPSTGPEAAALAGLPWDEVRFRTDPEYNKALGLAYFRHQIDTFGDEAKAVGAYNGGPGKVRWAMQKATDSGGNWLSYMPPETQKYVKAVLSGEQRIARKDGGRVDEARRDDLVGKLLKSAEAAKRAGKKSTEPLLHVSDDAVAKALEVAQRAI